MRKFLLILSSYIIAPLPMLLLLILTGNAIIAIILGFIFFIFVIKIFSDIADDNRIDIIESISLSFKAVGLWFVGIAALAIVIIAFLLFWNFFSSGHNLWR